MLFCTTAAVRLTGLPLPLQNPGLVEQYFLAILSLEPNQNYAGMLGLLVQFCTNHKETDVVSQHKASVQRGTVGVHVRVSGGKDWDLALSLWPAAAACVDPGAATGVTVDCSPLGGSHAPSLFLESGMQQCTGDRGPLKLSQILTW